jgi:hypothetical protein
LKPKERKEVMSWMQDLKFPDDYATGFQKSCIFGNKEDKWIEKS